jgi:hypothetical protein
MHRDVKKVTVTLLQHDLRALEGERSVVIIDNSGAGNGYAVGWLLSKTRTTTAIVVKDYSAAYSKASEIGKPCVICEILPEKERGAACKKKKHRQPSKGSRCTAKRAGAK